ncbi:hypothetical protein ACFUMH_09595 [Cellulomonas sp. NPDC057328]|uniref:hypothetical protein n=1 Tax=Cellulomonas sp. NPDC057328 TaxID=3346101 RepID=UPI003637B1B5
MRGRGRGRRTIATLAVAITALTGTATASQAATTTVSGTVNCTGSRTIYTTVRYMQTPVRTELYLSKASGGVHSGYDMRIGTYIVASGSYWDSWFEGADRYGVLQSGNNYVKDTRFRLGAQMDQASVGTCSNSWAGTLYY